MMEAQNTPKNEPFVCKDCQKGGTFYENHNTCEYHYQNNIRNKGLKRTESDCHCENIGHSWNVTVSDKPVTDEQMENYKAVNDELPKPPILNDNKLQKLTQDYYGFIKALPRNIENTFDIYSKLFNASISGNSTLINKYDKLSRQSVIILLEGENFIFKLDNEKRSKDHPRSWLNKAIIHSNESQIAMVKAIIVEIEGYIDGMGMGIDRNIESHTYTEQAKTSLNSAQKAILIGRTKIEPTRNSNRSSLSGTAFDKHIPIFDKISDSYHESFDIEGNILDILQVINDASPSDEDMQEAGILWASLVVKRTNLMSKRNKWFSKTLRQIKH